MSEINKARPGNRNPASSVPMPCGWDFEVVSGNVLIEPGPDEFTEYKDAYGYIASIDEASCSDTDAPLSCQVVTKLPFKYGFKREEYQRSFGYARVIAFTSKICVDFHRFYLLNFITFFGCSLLGGLVSSPAWAARTPPLRLEMLRRVF